MLQTHEGSWCCRHNTTECQRVREEHKQQRWPRAPRRLAAAEEGAEQDEEDVTTDRGRMNEAEERQERATMEEAGRFGRTTESATGTRFLNARRSHPSKHLLSQRRFACKGGTGVIRWRAYPTRGQCVRAGGQATGQRERRLLTRCRSMCLLFGHQLPSAASCSPLAAAWACCCWGRCWRVH